jgi:hypothetical protein
MGKDNADYGKAFRKAISQLAKDSAFRKAVFKGKTAAKKKLKTIITPEFADQVADYLYSDESTPREYHANSLKMIKLMAYVFGDLKDLPAAKGARDMSAEADAISYEPWDKV